MVVRKRELDIRCPVCGRRASEIREYKDGGYEYGLSPERFVMQEEGTYNQENGHFYCTTCYIKLGMPLGIAE
jgi:hypothetical protein